MFVLLGIIGQYVLLLGGTVFLTWLSVVEIRYQNKVCSSLNITKFIFNETNNSNVSFIDPRLKLNHFTILGTHNSYHRANLIYKYEHKSLDNQLTFGIRQLELDVHLMKNNLLVYHLQLFDDQTNCYCFKSCLMKIVEWMEMNPSHYPIYLFIEIKQMFYEDLMTGLTGGVKCEHFQEIKQEILDVFSSNTFILPSDVQGNQSSIRLALKQQRQDELSGDYSYKNYGWPPLSQSLGKLIPVFLDDVHNRARDLYSLCVPLQSFFFVCQTKTDLPYSSIISMTSITPNTDILLDMGINGQLIRLLVGYGGNNLDSIYQSSKQYGFHIISSDSEQCNDTQLCQSLTNDFRSSTIMCNQYFAPTFCNSEGLSLL